MHPLKIKSLFPLAKYFTKWYNINAINNKGGKTPCI
jgi:hypothetical protein